MGRLTFEGNFCEISQCRNVPGGSFCEDGACSQKKVWERLASYEDTGLTPEEVLPKDKADEIALKLMRLADLESLCNYTRLRELAKADKDGRLAVLPCKVGDTVWRIKRTFETYPDKSKPYIEPDAFLLQDVFNIGKTVFLNREEAKKAMKGETEK